MLLNLICLDGALSFHNGSVYVNDLLLRSGGTRIQDNIQINNRG